ncbi:hypothetical protein BS78_06G134800 [Paspalum vaginatum]|nr:hypothetical protein BS78_06G134800 [Paspalum vaginatum]
MLGAPGAAAAGSRSGAPPPPPMLPAMQDSLWIMNGEGLVKKIRNATQSLRLQLCELVAKPFIKCPNCKCDIDTSKVSLVWPALPAGSKFDPSDLDLLQHLQEKTTLPNSMSHTLIDNFIPTIEKLEGICYTHPKNLPGIKMDGSSLHFFYRASNAYGCGHRKRRKITGDDDVSDKEFRWHKTGDTKAICDVDGLHKGWKKILVLHSGSKRPGSKIVKENWVMYQYHLGDDKDEMDGEFVVSKVFYQFASKKNDKSETSDFIVEFAASDAKIDPRTPKTDPPQPRCLNNSPCNTEHEQYDPIQMDQEEEECGTSMYQVKVEASEPPPAVMHVDLPASDVPTDDPDAGHEAPQPVDGSNMELFDGLSDLDTRPCLGTLSDGISLANIHFGCFGGSLDSFY